LVTSCQAFFFSFPIGFTLWPAGSSHKTPFSFQKVSPQDVYIFTFRLIPPVCEVPLASRTFSSKFRFFGRSPSHLFPPRLPRWAIPPRDRDVASKRVHSYGVLFFLLFIKSFFTTQRPFLFRRQFCDRKRMYSS